MSDYLKRLATRLVEPPTQIRPRVASRFETPEATTAPRDRPRMADALPLQHGPGMPAHRPRAIRFPLNPSLHTDTPPDAPSERPTNGTTTPPSLATPDPAPAPRMQNSMATNPVRRESPAEVKSPQPIDEAVATTSPSRQAPPEQAGATPQPRPRPSSAPVVIAPRQAMTHAEKAETDGANRLAQQPADRLAPWRNPIERDARQSFKTASVKPMAATADPSPTVVQVTIGKVEVRGPAPPRTQSAAPARAAPRLSLQNYLQRRGESRQR